MKLISKQTRKITFELYDEHPKKGDYCVFANEKPEETDMKTIDFIFVQDIKQINNKLFIDSSDLCSLVPLKYSWKIKMSVHD